jgi:L-lysine exporter family protein LysE/ArgO
MNGFFPGLMLGFSLIVAIGSQNAFVLRQGLKREHVGVVCLICSISDAALISIGVFGFALFASVIPGLEIMARYGGALFLFCFGAKSFWAALKSNALTPAGDRGGSLMGTIAICLAFTWLNPHVYLDTVVLLGSVSTQYAGQRIWFWLGAVSASFMFFFSLGYGAKWLAPVFANPKAWKLLDLAIGCMMWSMALGLVRDALT